MPYEGNVKRSEKGRIIGSLICNLLILLLTIYGLSTFFFVGGRGNMTGAGSRCFVYFTVDSNVLAALASLLLLIAQWQRLRKGSCLDKALAALKLAGTTAVSLTLLTVVCFLSFLYDFLGMFTGVNLYMHLITPLLAILSFCLLEPDPPLRFRSVFLGLIPTFVYGAVYMIMVVGLRRWPDFYGFNIGGHWMLSTVLMLLATLLISVGLWAIRRAVFKKAGNQEPAVL